MEYKTVIAGGVMYTPVIAQKQIVYLDFDGEFTSYNGEILTVDGVEVQNSNLTAERIAAIVETLNTEYAAQNVVFVTEKPISGEYSTIYIGKTSAFDQYGSFAGLAETIDENNQNRSDNAFVLLDSTSDNNAIIETISHETDHLLGTLNHGGSGITAYAYIGSGQSSTGLVISSGNSVTIASGGVAKNITVNFGGALQVNGGGTAIAIKENGGHVWVSDAANVTFVVNTLNGLILNYQDAASLHDGTTANSTIVNERGHLNIYGGVANHTNINYRGWVNVYHGGVANSTIITDGRLVVSSGGLAKSTIVNRGMLDVSSGGTANCTTVNSGGIYVSSGGVATNITAASGAGLYLTVAPNTYWNGTYNGSAFEMKNAAITGYTVNRGYLVVSSGGVANRTIVKSSGYLRVYSGGIANNTILAEGKFYVSSGGVANNATVAEGRLEVSSGGVVNNISMNGGQFDVSSGGIANDISLFGGSLYVYHGGVANSTSVNSGGSLYISRGGTATEIKENGGYVSIADGANITFVANTFSNLVLSGNFATLHSRTSAYDITVNNGKLYVSSGGVANNISVNNYGYFHISAGGIANNTTVSNGYFYVSSGGITNSTTVNSGGYLWISNGGAANSTTVNSGGSIYISSGGIANNIMLNFSGRLNISNGAVTNSTFVNSKGSLYISSGGTATEIKENGGCVSFANGANVTFASNTFSGLVLSSHDSATLHSGTSAYDITVNSGGSLNVYHGGEANNTIVNFRSYFYVHSGGMANSTTVNSSGYLNIYHGGMANNTTVNSGGYLSISSCVVANNTTVNNGGKLFVSGGGIAENIWLNRGTLTVLDGGSATVLFNPWAGRIYSSAGAAVSHLKRDKEFYFGNSSVGCVSRANAAHNMSVDSGMSALAWQGSITDMTVTSGGTMYVLKDDEPETEVVSAVKSYLKMADFNNGGGVKDIDVVGGYLHVYGYAKGTSITRHGALFVHAGGISEENFVNQEGMIEVHGTARSNTVDEAGSMYVKAGGTATETSVTNKGYLQIENGGIAADTNINNAAMLIAENGSANILQVENSGVLNVAGDGRISNAIIGESGLLLAMSGADITNLTIRGEAQLAENSSLHGTTTIVSSLETSGIIAVDGIIHFELNTPNELVMANSYNHISSCDKFTFSNNSSENKVLYGLYHLMGNAGNFNGKFYDLKNNEYELWKFSGKQIFVRLDNNDLCAFSYTLPRSLSDLGTFLTESHFWEWEIFQPKIPTVTVSVSVDMPDLMFGFENFGRTVNKRPWLRFAVKDVNFSFSGRLNDNLYEVRLQGLVEFAAGILQVKANLAATEDHGIYLRYAYNEETKTLEEQDGDIVGSLDVTLQQIDHRYKLFAKTYTVTGKLFIDTRKNMFSISGELYTTTRSTITVTADFNNLFRDDNTDADSLTSRLWDSLSGLSFSGKNLKFKIGALTLYSIDLAWHQVTVNNQVEDFYSGGVSFTFMRLDLSENVTEKINSIFDTDIAANTPISAIHVSIDGKISSMGDFAVMGSVVLLAYQNKSGEFKSAIDTAGSVYVMRDTQNTEGEADDIIFVSGKLSLGDIITAHSSVTVTEQETIITIKGTVNVPKVFRWLLNMDANVLVEGGAIYRYFSGNHTLTVWGKVGERWFGSLYHLNLKTEVALSQNKSLQNMVERTYDKVEAMEEAVAQFIHQKDGQVSLQAIFESESDDINITISNGKGVQLSVNLSDYKKKSKGMSLHKDCGNTGITIEKFTQSAFVATVNGDAAGEWTITAGSQSSALYNVSFRAETTEAKIENFELDAVTISDRMVKVQYDCVTNGSGGQLYLYADTDNSGFDGMKVAELDQSGTYLLELAENSWWKPEYKYFYLLLESDALPTFSNYQEYQWVDLQKPEISADIIGKTNKNVTLTAAFDPGSVLNEYSIDGGEWLTYTTGIVMTQNGTVSFRSTDSTGLVSDVAEYQVKNIDKSAPGVVISGNPADWQNKNVAVSAQAIDYSSGIKSLLYSLDSGKTWNDYTDAVVMSKNGWVHFRAIDNAGNMSTKGVLVNKIDKSAPAITISGNPTEYTNKNVTVSMTAKDSSSGIKSLLYSLDSGKTWNDYTDAVVMSKNGWIHFRAIDNAGNMSTKGVLVNKIDKIAPTVTITGNPAEYTNKNVTVSMTAKESTSGIKSLLYSLDSGKTWNDYTDAVVMSKNSWIHFRAIDNAGNMSTKGVLVNKIDKTAPTIQISGLPAEYTQGTVTITGKAVDNGSGLKSLLYSLDSGKTWKTYTAGVTFTQNGWIHFRATDNAGNISTKGLLVNKIDKTAPVLQLNTSGNKVSAVSADKESGLASFEYSFDGKTWVTTANHKAVTLKNGDSVTFRAIDNVGNVTKKQYDYNTIDYNALKNYDTLAATDLTGNNPESDIMKGLLA